TTSWSTETKPPWISTSVCWSPDSEIRTVPGARTASTGWCPASTPISPSLAGTRTRSASPDQNVRSGPTMLRFSAMRLAPPSCPALRVSTGLLQALVGRLQVLEPPDVEEGLLRDVVELPVSDLLEGFDGLTQRNVRAHHTGEFLGHIRVLRQELLDTPGPVDGDLVLLGEFVDSEDGDDVLQLLVLLQDTFDAVGDLVVLLTDVSGIEDSRGGGQRVHRGVQAPGGDVARQLGSGVEVGEGRGRCRVGEVVGGHI